MTYSLFFIGLALHLAVMQGRLNNVRALLTESNIDAEAYNLRSGLKHLNLTFIFIRILIPACPIH